MVICHRDLQSWLRLENGGEYLYVVQVHDHLCESQRQAADSHCGADRCWKAEGPHPQSLAPGASQVSLLYVNLAVPLCERLVEALPNEIYIRGDTGFPSNPLLQSFRHIRRD